MAKITIPANLTGKDLHKFLIENKEDLVAQKKSMLKYTEAIEYAPELFLLKEGTATKSAVGEIPKDANTVRVKVVANSAWFCDSHMDVLIPDCWSKSIKERKGLIPHLCDHEHKVGTDAEIGDVVDIYSQELSLSELGLNKTGTTQALIFITDVKKAYNEVVFNKYRTGKIKQHSIGLMYVKIELAINDEESEKEYAFWTKYYQNVINKDLIEEKGYFWVVSEIKLLENSAVLFGSNILTPTLEVKSDDTEDEPSEDTQKQPSGVNKSMFASIGESLQPAGMFATIGKQL